MRSSAVIVGLGLATGCGFTSPDTPGDGQGPGMGPDACVSFATLLDTCQLTFEQDLTLTGALNIYDTDAHELRIGGAPMPLMQRVMQIDGIDVDVISVRELRLPAQSRLRANGAMPLAIVASGNVFIEGNSSIDVSLGGAGARTGCGGGAMAGQNSTNGAAGGGGGGYATAGGKGGNADDGGIMGGAAGQAVSVTPVGLLGGCPGAKGGNGEAQGGPGGLGGGAIYVVAADSIQLSDGASINAGGGGGKGGGRLANDGDAGGGGGGSGGMIIVQALHVLGQRAVIAANGGGGGEGSEDDDDDPGAGGEDGTLTTSRAAGGGGASTQGADGGAGGGLDGPAGEAPGEVRQGGGGGGGGGVGIIRILSADIQVGVISPARTP